MSCWPPARKAPLTEMKSRKSEVGSRKFTSPSRMQGILVDDGDMPRPTGTPTPIRRKAVSVVLEDALPSGRGAGKPKDLVLRTRLFALAVMDLVDRLPSRPSTRVIANQLLRAATAVGANYRSARRARSGREFLARLGVVEEEADECVYWLSLLRDSHAAEPASIEPLVREADELCAMIVAAINTSRKNAKD